MRLRSLELKDAPLMYEWMQDLNVIKDLQADFLSKKLLDCENFIEASKKTENNLHLAIVDDTDEYMGTVSLKHIDKAESAAEFAITIRSVAMGKGMASFAIREIIDVAREKYGIKNVYWCVSPDNHRAVRFYDKNAYRRLMGPPAAAIIAGAYTPEQQQFFYWYDAQ